MMAAGSRRGIGWWPNTPKREVYKAFIFLVKKTLMMIMVLDDSYMDSEAFRLIASGVKMPEWRQIDIKRKAIQVHDDIWDCFDSFL